MSGFGNTLTIFPIEMKQYNPFYYLLFILLIMGSFASMALNSYGLKIVAGVCVAFAVIFLTQLIYQIRHKGFKDRLGITELISLATLATIFCLRVMYIHFSLVELIFGIAGILLAVVYSIRLVRNFNRTIRKNKRLAYLILFFNSSLVFYILSMTVLPFAPSMSEPAGILGFTLVIAFVVLSYLNKGFIFEGNKITSFQLILQRKDRSILLMSMFILFSFYAGLTRINFLPGMYSDEFPQAYFHLVNQAERGEEKSIDGVYSHQEFKAMYDSFVEREIESP